MTDTTMLDAALGYARRGWPVFPLRPRSKGTFKGSHGFLDATTDEAQIRAWWTQRPGANIGLAVAAAGLVAVDVDPRHGGNDTIETLEFTHGPLDRAAMQLSGGEDGGYHLLFRSPPDARYPGTAGTGVDMRHRAFIVLAPSLHKDTGRPYRWASLPDTDAGIPVAPAWLAKQPEPARAPRDLAVTEGQWAEILEALPFIDPDGGGYHLWRDIGMALESTGRPEAFEVWDTWSQTGDYPGPDTLETLWRSFDASKVAHPTDYTCIFKHAKAGGWTGARPPMGHHFDVWVEPEMVDGAAPEAVAELIDPAALGILPPEAPKPDVFIQWAEWEGREVPPRRWLVEGRIGMDHVTGLYGRGGIGKSWLTQQLASCVATGREFLNTPTMGGRVLGLYCEDDERELVERQSKIARGMGVSLRDLQGRFLTQARVGLPNVLVEASTLGGTVRPSALYAAVERNLELAHAQGDPIALLILDNIAQMMSLNENDRVQVTQAMNLVAHLAVDYGCALLLLGHPAKSQESVQSGSSAWTNVMRSMLYLGKGKDDAGLEKRGDILTRELSQEKGNYSKMPSLQLKFENGLYQRMDIGPVAVELAALEARRRGTALETLSRGLEALRALGVTDATHQKTSKDRYLPKLLAAHELLGTCTAQEIGDVLPLAISTGRVVIRTARDARHGRDKTWIEPKSVGFSQHSEADPQLPQLSPTTPP